MFFDALKKKIRNKNLLSAFLFPLVAIGVIWMIAQTGFSSDCDWSLAHIIPIPNWVISSIFVLLALGCVAATYSAIRDIFTNETFNEVIATAQSFGDVAVIDQMLHNTPKSNLAKGELRCNNYVFFYRSATEVFLVPTGTITAVQPVQRTGKRTEYYVEISTQNKSVKIETKKKNLLPLANEILAWINASR